MITRPATWIAVFLAGVCAQTGTTHSQQKTEEQLVQRAEIMRARIAGTAALVSETGGRLPPLVEAHIELGMALQQLNHLKPDGGKRIAEAENAYRSALRERALQEPTLRAQVQGNLAALLLEAGRAEDSLREVEQALRLVQDPGLMFNRAKTLSTMGLVKEADQAYHQAAMAAYGKELSSFSKATAAMEVIDDALLSLMEETAEGLRAVMQARGGGPGGIAAGMLPTLVPGGLNELGGRGAGTSKQQQGAKGGRGGKEKGGKAQTEKEKAWLQGGGDVEMSWLGFGVYKARDKRKEYDAAWAALTWANAHMQRLQNYSYEHDLKTYNTLVSVFKSSYGAMGFHDDTPIFVVGLPRSGSTLVEQILASHSAAWGAGEDTALAPLTPEVNAALSTPGVSPDVVLASIGKKYVDMMRERVPLERRPAPAADAGAAAATAAAEPPLPPPRRIVDKMLRNLWLVGYIDLLLPRATILHIVRHPMDAGLSCFAQPFGYNGMPWAWDLHNIASQINFTFQLAAHWDQAYPGRVHTVHYEELIEYPRQVASELLALAGLPWEEEVLSFHRAVRSVATASMNQVRQPLYSSSVARWKRYEKHLAPLREALGGTVEMYEARLEAALERRRATEAVLNSRREQALRKGAAAAAAGGDRGAWQQGGLAGGQGQGQGQGGVSTGSPKEEL